MRTHVQVALGATAAFFLLSGLSLVVAPEATHALYSRDALNPAMTGMHGASLFAFATLFLIATHEPAKPIVHASAVALFFYGAGVGYQAFFMRTMPLSAPVVASLIVSLAVAAFLAISLTEPAAATSATRSVKAAPRRRRPRAAQPRRARA
ncbi:hypothetical protein [Sulfurifustis variabilis]|uniref:hypothetical protein n=1 Tax=Sulfurifustis variabilis TaxID=1675686 RepID=UPI000BBA4FBA|nr:hypothetical protein [Sulfurifustis variabilis]